MGLFKKDKKAMTFDNAMEERRSIYNLKDSISISDDELKSMIAHELNMFLHHLILNQLELFSC